MKKDGLIPEKFYRKIVASMPVPCVDVVVTDGGRFLLGKRRRKPAQGKWWLPGGRVLKMEHLERAARRHVVSETGIRTMKIVKILGAQETMLGKSAQGPASHTISVVFLAKVPKKEVALPPDSEFSEAKRFSRIPGFLHPYVKKMLSLAGFK